MKKLLTSLATLTTAALVMFSCSTDDEVTPVTPDPEPAEPAAYTGGQMSLYAAFGETTPASARRAPNPDAPTADITGNFNVKKNDLTQTNLGTSVEMWTINDTWSTGLKQFSSFELFKRVTDGDVAYAYENINRGQLIAWGVVGQTIEGHTVASSTIFPGDGDRVAPSYVASKYGQAYIDTEGKYGEAGTVYNMMLGIRNATDSRGQSGKIFNASNSNGMHFKFLDAAPEYYFLIATTPYAGLADCIETAICSDFKYIECPDGAEYIGFDVDGDGDYSDWMLIVNPSNLYGEVETNFSLLDEHVAYTDSVLTAKLTTHVRALTDVEIRIPVPADFRSYLCEVDDFDIRNTDGSYDVYNANMEKTITDSHGISVTYSYDTAKGEVVITTSGIADHLNECTVAKETTFVDGTTKKLYEFTFEVYVRYWCGFDKVDVVRQNADKATITSLAEVPAGDEIYYLNTKVAAGTEVTIYDSDADGNPTTVIATDKYGALKQYTKTYDDFCVTAVANQYNKTMTTKLY